MARGGGLARDVRSGLSPGEGRKFALSVGGAFLVLAAIFWWRDHLTVAGVIGTVGVILALAGVVVPAHLGPLYRVWMGLALAISKVTTPVFMGIVYYLVLTPTGILRRTFGRNPLRREDPEGSYWISRDERGRSDLQRQF